MDRRLRAKVSDSDLVQKTLIKANRHFEQFSGSTEPELTNWLRAIMSRKKATLARRYFGTQARDPRLALYLQDQMDATSRHLNHAFFSDHSTPSQQRRRF